MFATKGAYEFDQIHLSDAAIKHDIAYKMKHYKMVNIPRYTCLHERYHDIKYVDTFYCEGREVCDVLIEADDKLASLNLN